MSFYEDPWGGREEEKKVKEDHRAEVAVAYLIFLLMGVGLGLVGGWALWG